MKQIRSLLGERGGVALFLAVALVACNSGQTIDEEVTDVWITSTVTAKITADPEVNPFEIDVDTTDGVVHLRGMVETEQQRREAEELARLTKGVQDVVNDIELGAPTLDENVEDARIVAEIKVKLAAEIVVESFVIDVDAVQGAVTLTGVVDTENAKLVAGAIAEATKGVVRVDNLIEVKRSS